MFGRIRNWAALALVATALLVGGCVGGHHSQRSAPMNEVDGVLQGPS